MAKKKEAPTVVTKRPTKLVHVEPETHQKVKVYAAQVGEDMKDVVNQFVEDGLKRAKPAGAKP